MKKLSSIFLALSMFLNLGFIFSGAKASIVPVPLSIIGNKTQPGVDGDVYINYRTATTTDIRDALYRITYLEAIRTSQILGQSIGYTEESDFFNSLSDRLNARRNAIEFVVYNINPNLIDTTNSQIITNRISEIRSKISSANQRVSDLKSLMRAFILGVQGPNVNGVDSNVTTGDINLVRQELYRAKEYKEELENALRFWAHLIGSNEADLIKITSINPNRAMTGNIISIDGEGFSKAFAIILNGANVDKRIEIPANSILSNNRISFTVPDLPGVTGDIPVAISVIDDEANVTPTRNPNFTYQGNTTPCPQAPTCNPSAGCTYINPPKDANGCVTGCGTLSCPNGDSCRCPSGQVYVSIGGAKKCSTFNTSNLSCTRYGNNPVCGCDGMTYQNSCFALINGLKTFTNGACN